MTQDQAFAVLTLGKNVFLTGAAGSGKTHVLLKYISWLRARGVEPAITASTGIAATHLGGQTIHAWSGIGIQRHLDAYDLDAISQNERLVKRFQKTRVLIIDEISMLSAKTFEMVNQAITAGLGEGEPFGGMQVVLCGDFFQLPPVSKANNSEKFAFESSAWKDLGATTCYLTEQYRQEDATFLNVLNEVRSGNVSRKTRILLGERIVPAPLETIPHLYTHNVDVDELNEQRLQALPGTGVRFTMKTKGRKSKLEALKKSILAPEVLTLKKGAVVMFIKNHQQGTYVNGTLGTVHDFSKGQPIVKTYRGKTIFVEPEEWRIEDGKKVLAEVTQIPLKLAWAVTIHKSQGVTLDAAYMDLTKTFVEGQGYVALSRVKTLDGLYIKGIHEYAFLRHPAVAKMDEYFQKASDKTIERLKATSPERLRALSSEFILRAGGHEPSSTQQKSEALKKAVKERTFEKTHNLLKKGATIQEIAQVRNLSQETILTHIEKLLTLGHVTKRDIEHVLVAGTYEESVLDEIARAFALTKTWSLSPVRTKLKEAYTFEELRVARLFLRPWGKE